MLSWRTACATLVLVAGCSEAKQPSTAVPSAASSTGAGAVRGASDLAAAPAAGRQRLRWELPLPQGNDLHAATAGAQGVFAAGDSGTILRRDGGQWQLEPSGSSADLLALYTMQSDGAVWAAGTQGTLLRRRPGKGWEAVPTGSKATLRALYSCTSNRRAPAAGDAASTGTETLIAVGATGTLLRVDGTRVAPWPLVEEPAQPDKVAKARDYSGVWGTSCEDLFFAEKSDLWHTDGSTLKRAYSAFTQPGVNQVIGSSSGVVFASGDDGQEIVRRKGEWYFGGGDLVVHALAGSGLGPFARVGERGGLELIVSPLRDDEPQWVEEDSGTLRDLYGAAFASANELYLVGQGGILLRWNGKSVTREQLALTELDLLAVTRLGSSLLAVGEAGTILRHDGHDWQRMSSPTAEDLTAVWADDKRAFAVGIAGACLRFDGERWQLLSSMGEADLRAVSGRPGGPVYAVGADGMFAELLDTTCRTKQTPVTETLLGVAIDAAGTVFAVGRSGVSLRRQKESWVREPTGTTADLSAIFASDAEPPIAIAAGEATLRWDGGRWQNLGPALEGLVALSGSSSKDLYAAGANGRIARFTGDNWQPIELDVAPDLNGLAGSRQSTGSLAQLIAVGAGGTIVRLDLGAAP